MTVRVTFICLGNICRSPMAEVVLRGALQREGLADRVEVDSAGTGGWDFGQPADERAIAVLARHGYDPGTHVARQYTRQALADADLVIALDRGHERTLRSWAGQSAAGPGGDVRLLRSFDPDADTEDVDDPYYGEDADFERVLAQIEAAVPGILDDVRARLSG